MKEFKALGKPCIWEEFTVNPRADHYQKALLEAADYIAGYKCGHHKRLVKLLRLSAGIGEGEKQT